MPPTRLHKRDARRTPLPTGCCWRRRRTLHVATNWMLLEADLPPRQATRQGGRGRPRERPPTKQALGWPPARQALGHAAGEARREACRKIVRRQRDAPEGTPLTGGRQWGSTDGTSPPMGRRRRDVTVDEMLPPTGCRQRYGALLPTGCCCRQSAPEGTQTTGHHRRRDTTADGLLTTRRH